MAKTIWVDEDVRQLLGRAVVEGGVLVKFPGKVDRALYVKLDKVLRALGGKWDRKLGGHLFPNPVNLNELVRPGADLTVVDKKKELGQFWTPEPLAATMADWVHAFLGKPASWTCLEPEAGSGRLALAASKLGATLCCFEVDATLVQRLHLMGFQCSAAEPFLTVSPVRTIADHGRSGDSGFDAVLMNPPFAKSMDAKHALHAWDFLRPGGAAAIITSPGVKFRKTRPYPELRAPYARYAVQQVDIDPGTFAESGTEIGAVLTILMKS